MLKNRLATTSYPRELGNTWDTVESEPITPSTSSFLETSDSAEPEIFPESKRTLCVLFSPKPLQPSFYSRELSAGQCAYVIQGDYPVLRYFELTGDAEAALGAPVQFGPTSSEETPVEEHGGTFFVDTRRVISSETITVRTSELKRWSESAFIDTPEYVDDLIDD